jgi:hypothetical protein
LDQWRHDWQLEDDFFGQPEAPAQVVQILRDPGAGNREIDGQSSIRH